MYNTSLRILGKENDAEDIMQESFLAAFQKLSSFKGDSSFGSWLKSIVVNNSINALRKRKEIVEIEEDAGILVTEPEETTDPEYTLDDVHKGIEMLPDGYRVIINLYLIEGYDHEEIGNILKINSSTSRSQFNRARNKLKEIIINKKWATN